MASTRAPVRESRSLRFYSEVLGLERMNYGIWNPGDELTFENLKRAQQRYEDHLVERIPHDARRVLDVGCGTGVLSARLLAAGFDVEGLSPSPAQQASFVARCDAPFHLCRFQDFEPAQPFDCLVMSESAQYVPLDQLFPGVLRCLSEGGTLVLSDFFTRSGAAGIQARSGHDLDAFRGQAEAHGLRVVAEHDITEAAAPTMELATDYARRAEIALDLATDRLRHRRPVTARVVMWIITKSLAKLDRQRPLIDPVAFRENKRYMSFVFAR